MIGDALLLVGVHDPLSLLKAGGHTLDALGELHHRDGRSPGACGQKRRLVDQVGEIGPDKSGRDTGDLAEIDRFVNLHSPNMDFKDLLAAADVGPIDQHVSVEASGAKQGRIERFRAVRGGHHNDAAVGSHAVHFHQQCIKRLLAFVVAADDARAAGLAQRVQLVDEDDARGLGHRLLEHVADPRGADTDEHFHEVGTGKTEEGHARLAGHGLAQQRLAGARRPDEQHALGNASAEDLVLFGLLEEIDDFAEFLNRFVDAGHLVERDADVFLGQQLSAAAAESHRRARAGQPAEQEVYGETPENNQRHKHEGGLPRIRQ